MFDFLRKTLLSKIKNCAIKFQFFLSLSLFRMLKYIGLISSVFGHWNHTYGHIYSPEPKKHMINGVFAPNEVVIEKNTEWLERVHHS